MAKLFPFIYSDWSLSRNDKVIQPMNENLWFREHQTLLLAIANHPEGKDLLCIDQNLPPIIEIAKNHVTCLLDIDNKGQKLFRADFRVGAKWANIIRYRWPDFVKFAKEYLPYKKSGLYRRDVSGLLAATLDTSFPDAGVGGTTVDGHAQHSTAADDWDGVHDGVGNLGSPTGTSINLDLRRDSGSPITTIGRGIMLFDTSGIGATHSVISATVSLYDRDNLVFTDNDAQAYFSIVQTNNISLDNNIVSSDYTDVGDAIDNPTEGIDSGDRIRMEDSATSAYNDFPLNTTGKGWVDTSGITYLGIREGHDIEDVPIADGLRNFKRWWAADNGSLEPKLVVDYAILIQPSALPLTATLPEPSYSATARVDSLVAPITMPVPDIIGALILEPDALTLSTTLPEPFVQVVFINPATLALTSVLSEPIVDAPIIVTPDVLIATISIPDPSVLSQTAMIAVHNMPSGKTMEYSLVDEFGVELQAYTSVGVVEQVIDATAEKSLYYTKSNLVSGTSQLHIMWRSTDAVPLTASESIDIFTSKVVNIENEITSKLDVAVSSRASDVDMELLLSYIKNKKVIKKTGSVWSLKIYNAAGNDFILTKELKDKDGNNITDIAAGIMAQELANSA